LLLQGFKDLSLADEDAAFLRRGNLQVYGFVFLKLRVYVAELPAYQRFMRAD